MPCVAASVGKRCMVSHSRICTTLACLLAVAVMMPAFATPEPAPAPVSWEFQMKPTIPYRITASTRKGSQTYWYFLYKVVNNTGEDRPFHPEIARVNQIMSEVPADKARQKPGEASSITVDPAIVGLEKNVFEAIKERHKATHPFLMHPVDAITTLRQGSDNAIASVAVFKEMDPRVARFTYYFTGLSGEQIIRPNPLFDPQKPADEETNPRVFVLRKTWAMPYILAGDAQTRRFAKPRLLQAEWVMR